MLLVKRIIGILRAKKLVTIRLDLLKLFTEECRSFSGHGVVFLPFFFYFIIPGVGLK